MAFWRRLCSLSISVGALYVRKHFREDSKRAAMEMVNGIRREFEKILHDVPWMDDDTREAALNKVKSMSTHIGYPDEIMDNKKLEEYYNHLEIDANDYLKSVLRMNVFGTDYAFNKLRKPVNKTDWVTHARPAIVNAFYSSIENSIRKFEFIFGAILLHSNAIFVYVFCRVSSRHSARSILFCRASSLHELRRYWFRYRS